MPVHGVSSTSGDSQQRGALLLRTLPILSAPIAVGLIIGFVLNLSSNEPLRQAPNMPSPIGIIVFIAVFFSALVMLVRLGRARLSVYLLIAVWTLFTTFLGLQSSVTTVWPALLILPICVAGLLIDGAASVSLAGLATILITSLGWLEMQYQNARIASTLFDPSLPLFPAMFWVGMYWSVAALTFLFAGGMQRALAQSRAQAAELRELSAQLKERVQAQTHALLAREREAAVLEERTRVAREIHDTLAQGLTGVIVQLGAAERALSASSPSAPEHLELAQEMAREALNEARRSIWNLRSPTLEHATLRDALQGVVARQANRNIAVTFKTQGEACQVPPAAESALLRVCQEALVNVMKHSNATRAQVVLEYAPTSVRLSVSDDGVGFEGELLQSPNDMTSGFGLLGMRERIHALGGTLELHSADGAHVIATIPRWEEEA